MTIGYQITIKWRSPSSRPDRVFNSVTYHDGMYGSFQVYENNKRILIPWDLIKEIEIIHMEDLE